MKLLLRLLLLVMMGSAYAQSNLPVCQGSDDSRWTNCYGSLTFLYGQKYIGEFRGGQANGQGTYTLSLGFVALQVASVSSFSAAIIFLQYPH